MPAPLDVYFVLPRGSLILDWAGPAEALRIANLEVQDADPGHPGAFALHFVAPHHSSLSSVGALIAGLAPLPASVDAPAWVVVVGKTGTGRTRADGRADEMCIRDSHR